MNAERLNELLRSLPREEASDSFTQNVMGRTRSVRAFADPQVRMVLVWATVVVILVSGAVGHLVSNHRDQARLESIRAEQRQIENELQELKRLSEGYSSVVHVDGNNGVEYVVDLNEFSRNQQSNRQTSRVSSQIQ